MRRTIEVMLGVAIVLDVVYGALGFGARSTIASPDTPAYDDFENAFPLAGAWVGAACVLALIRLRTSRPAAHLGPRSDFVGAFWLLCAGAAGLYLGCMDLLYDLENDVFTAGGGSAFEAVIVALTWVFALTVLIWSWRHRDELLADSGPSDAAP